MKIGLIFGGKSAEYEVSLQSARHIYDRLNKDVHEIYLIGMDRDGYMHYFEGSIEEVADGTWIGNKSSAQIILYSNNKKPGIYDNDTLVTQLDLIFPVLHGPYGEDGKLQGLLELSGLPYVGCGVIASANAMDKDIAKKIFAYDNINQVDHLTFYSHELITDSINRIEMNLGYPCFIKPANMGSSVGISKAKDKEQLIQAINKAFEYDHKIVVEKAVNAREIEVAVLGNCDDIKISVAGEIIPSDEFYDYDAKYNSNESKLIIPAELNFETLRQIEDMAYKAYKGLNAEGLCRIDFFVDKDTQKVYLNEVNSMPGFTSISMYPKLWENSGISYKTLLEELIALALKRHKRDSSKKNK